MKKYLVCFTEGGDGTVNSTIIKCPPITETMLNDGTVLRIVRGDRWGKGGQKVSDIVAFSELTPD